MKRVIVGVTGATGTIYGVRLMELMRTDSEIEIHLVMSRSAKLTLKMEHDLELDYINTLPTKFTSLGISELPSRPVPSILKA